MKKLLVGSLVAGGLIAAVPPSGPFADLAASTALAADLGGRPVRPPRDFAPPYYRPQSNLESWTGFYVGGTLGYGFGEGRTGGDIGRFGLDQDGALGTIFAGYNWQAGRGVFGLEADLGTGGFGSRTSAGLGNLQTEINAMGSFRARAGLLVTPALMLYATGGLAWANMEFGYAGLTKVSDTLFGYQVGAGAEYLMGSNVSLRLEYLYTDLERERVLHSGQTNFYDPDFHQVRAGIAFKF